MQSELESNFDVVVIGGGPAGSTVAALLAQFGRRTLLLERSLFPRFHVGESLIPETYWTLERLGLIPWLKSSAYPKKYSVQFFSEGYKESAPFYFDEYKPHESSQTWQVWRGEFDQALLANAAAKGAVVRTDAQVLDVLFDGDTAIGVRARFDARDALHEREIPCRVVVDATGQSAFLANRLGLVTRDPRLKKGTIWGYFQGAQRDAGRDEGATLLLQTAGKKSWFWYIPLTNDMVSVGCTGRMDYMFPKGRTTVEETFDRELDRCLAMQSRLRNAVRCDGFYTTKDFSYRTTRAAGPGWVLVGDAFGFIDPVYSTGVFLAFKSGEFAADAIHAAFEKHDFSAAQLGGWQEQHVAGIELFRKLVYAFYAPDFSFGQFMREHPQYKSHLADMLMGNVFQPGVGEIFEVMGEVLPPFDAAPEPVAVSATEQASRVASAPGPVPSEVQSGS